MKGMRFPSPMTGRPLTNDMRTDTPSYLEVQPSQFYVSAEKLRKIEAWLDPEDLSNFEPIPVKEMNGTVIFTDGHTRAFAAWRAGLREVPLVWDADELDWELYQICVDACLEQGISNITHLENRVLPPEEYREKWNLWCDDIQSKTKDAP